ncbi:hypothetical protein [Haloarchaeobius sp. TZWSO28]|uniref:hypothetical protein n=1 Tax=Haloarchaeobius sp. TZWSO28 TaxID=3446119 RepID=UPI003EBFC04E
MGIDFEAAVVAAIERTATRAGGTLALCTFVVQFISAVGFDTEQAYLQRQLLSSVADALGRTSAAQLEQGRLAVARGALGLPASVPHWYGTVLAAVAAALGVAVTVVGLRTFSGAYSANVPRTAVAGLPSRTAHAVLGSVLFTSLVVGGLVLFVVPGVFLALTLYFVTAAVAIEDESVFAGLRRSWELTAGNRLDSFLFVCLLAAVTISATITSTAVASVLGGAVADQAALASQLATATSPVARLASIAITSVATVFTVALTAVVFDQLRDATGAGGRGDDLADIDPALLP